VFPVLVRDILVKKGGDVLTVARDATVAEAVAAMCSKGVGSALVLDAAGMPAGILTERDVLRLVARHGGDLGAQKVGESMTAPVQTTTPETTVMSVMHQMTRNRFRHVPVVDGGRVVGIVSIGDVVKTRLEETELEAESLRQYISNSY
jgi:CBS domain-containing protein